MGGALFVPEENKRDSFQTHLNTLCCLHTQEFYEYFPFAWFGEGQILWPWH